MKNVIFLFFTLKTVTSIVKGGPVKGLGSGIMLVSISADLLLQMSSCIEMIFFEKNTQDHLRDEPFN